jgi:alpha-tubulin suppressor-like RCC1 family protein
MLPSQVFATSATDQQADESVVLSAIDSTEDIEVFATLDEAVDAGVVADVPEDDETYVQGEILIIFKEQAEPAEEVESVEEAVDYLSVQNNQTEVETISSLRNGSDVAVASLPGDVSVEDALLAAANDENVAFAQPNFIYTTDSTSVNDPSAGWELEAVHAFDAWDHQTTDGAVTIAVMDTGARLTHPDLVNNLWVDEAWDAVRSQPLTDSVEQGLVDNNGDAGFHGTGVTSVAVAEANNGIGMAGSSYNAKILPIMIEASYGISSAAIVIGSEYILDMKDTLNIRVVNLSFGQHRNSAPSESLLQSLAEYRYIIDLTDAGILVVASAGNMGNASVGTTNDQLDPATGHNRFHFPSDMPQVVAVTATDSSDEIADFSDHNQYKDIAAPGDSVEILLGFDDFSTTAVSSGTSNAAPMVAGVAALLFAADSSLTPEEAKNILCETATDLGDPGHDPYYGWGLLNADAAVQAVQTSSGVTPVMAIGGSHSVFLKADGTVWAWGFNGYGQLGNGTFGGNSTTPGQVNGLSDVVSISAGWGFSMALKADGTVWTWGYNVSGPLGDGTTTSRSTPAQVSGLSNVVAIEAGEYHAVALKSDGTVWSWGDNINYQLGDGTSTNRYAPVQAIGISDVVSVSAGRSHTVALKSDGTVWAWGNNSYGQLGGGRNIIGSGTFPTPSTYLTDVVSVSAGYYHTVALKSDGTVWACGFNLSGQMGDGTTETRYTPVQVSNLTDVSAIETGTHHNFVIKSDGTVWGWGNNGGGVLGDGTTIDKYTPVQTTGISNVASVSAGQSQVSAITTDGEVWMWGNNGNGGLGNGTYTSSSTPVAVVWDINALTISANETSSGVFSNQTLGSYEGSRYFDADSMLDGTYIMSDGSIVEISRGGY